MKDFNWKLGLVVSVALSLITLSFRASQPNKMDWGVASIAAAFDFSYYALCWIFQSVLLSKTKQLGYKLSSKLFAVLCILNGAAFMFIFDWGFRELSNNMLQVAANSHQNKFFSISFRSILINGLYYFILHYLRVLSDRQQHTIEIEKLKQAQLAANLSSLKEQLSPHFLFNTLNTLISITNEKPVKDYVSELANVYRYVLTYKKVDTATLQQELSFMDSYVYIIKARMEKVIDIEIKVEDHLLRSLLPPLTLHLLIENAIKHNVAALARPLNIRIYNEADNYLVISNNYQPKSAGIFSTGIGLENVLQRYALLFNREIIIKKTQETFSVQLPIIIP